MTCMTRTLTTIVGALLISATPLLAQQGGHGNHGNHGAQQGSKQGAQQGAKQGEHAMQGGKGAMGAGDGHKESGWTELDAFHAVMASAWHPARNDSLAPTRATAAQLVASAKTLAAATAPSACKTPEIASAIAKLVAETETVASQVASNADDTTLKAAIKSVHDTFEVAEKGCKPAGGAHQGHGSGHREVRR
jgi:hypothetical protein